MNSPPLSLYHQHNHLQQQQQQQDQDSDNEDTTTTLPTLSFNHNAKSAIFNVATFQYDFYNAIQKETIDPTLELLSSTIDISVNDIKPKTHYQIVENEIKSSLMNLSSSSSSSSSSSYQLNQPQPQRSTIQSTTTNTLMTSNNNTTTPSSTINTTCIDLPIISIDNVPTIDFESNNNNNHNNNNNINTNNNNNNNDNDPFSKDEVILSVALYHPQKSTKIQEFLVVGSQRLSDLRDKIYCMRDNILDGWKRKSSFFFINNIFYNDLRDPQNISYSKTINEWISNKNDDPKYSGSTFHERDMSLYRFDELDISIGEKYLYCNQGNCEHIMVFKQMRLINDNDSFNRSDYPIETFHAKLRRKKCKVCEIYPAKFVTVGDKLVDETPYFFCEECYRIFHYDKEGKLLYSDYEVYPYFHE